jgi:hypothetical protein
MLRSLKFVARTDLASLASGIKPERLNTWLQSSLEVSRQAASLLECLRA